MTDAKIFFVPALKKVLPQEKLDGGSRKRRNLYRHGRLHLQFVVFSERILFEKSLLIETDLPSLKVERVGYLPSLVPVREDHDDYLISDQPGLYPDSLLPEDGQSVNIVPGVNNCFMITVEDDGKLKEGRYPVTVTLCDRREPICRAETEVQFVDAEFLPADVTYFNWIHYDSIAVCHGVKPFTKRYYRILRSYLNWAQYSGLNVLLVPLITPPLDTYVGGYRRDVQLADIFFDGSYRFDFERLGEFLDFAMSEGIDRFEFPPFFSQWDASYAAPFLVRTPKGRERRFGWGTQSLSDDYRAFLAQFLESLAEYLRKRGVFDRCYFHVCDEAQGKDNHYEKCRSLVTERLPGGKFIDTKMKFTGERHPDFIDVLSLSEADKSIESGVVPDAVYYCWGDYKNGVSNRFFSMPLARTAVIWPQMYLNHARTFLHWGFNFYQDFLSHHSIDPYAVTDVGGVFPSGDGFLVYPDREHDGAFPSIRLYALAYGRLLYRMLLTLERTAGRAEAEATLRRYGMDGYGRYPRNDEWLYELEEELVRKIRKGTGRE